MTARDALAAIQERAATARVRATEDEADLARWPTRLMSQSQHDRRLLARDNVRLVGALEAVLDALDKASDQALASYQAEPTSYGEGWSDAMDIAYGDVVELVTKTLEGR